MPYTTSSPKADHEAGRAFFKTATLQWDLAKTLLYKMGQMSKFIGLMFGLEEGYMFLSQNFLK